MAAVLRLRSSFHQASPMLPRAITVPSPSHRQALAGIKSGEYIVSAGFLNHPQMARPAGASPGSLQARCASSYDPSGGPLDEVSGGGFSVGFLGVSGGGFRGVFGSVFGSVFTFIHLRKMPVFYTPNLLLFTCIFLHIYAYRIYFYSLFKNTRIVYILHRHSQRHLLRLPRSTVRLRPPALLPAPLPLRFSHRPSKKNLKKYFFSMQKRLTFLRLCGIICM